MRRVEVISKKFDGTLREKYETCLCTKTEEAITLFSPPGLSYMDYRKAARLEAPDGIIEIYPKDKWFNVFHIAESSRHADLIYVNLASPATLHGGRVEWTDLDIDYKLRLGGEVLQLDADEFAYNTRRMGYPQDLIRRVEAACREVERGLAEQTYPFDHEKQVALYWQIKNQLEQLG